MISQYHSVSTFSFQQPKEMLSHKDEEKKNQHLNFFLKNQMAQASVALLVGASSHKMEGVWFDSQSGHI